MLSFAIWGVADVFTGWGRGALAKVGSQEIRVEDYQRAFQNEINQISQQAGRRITTEQAHAAGLDNRVLAQLIAWSAVETHANELGLALSDASLAEAMKNDPAFKGPDGKFNRLAFENVIDRLGVSERGFLQLRRRDELREQLTSALINGVAVPDSMLELVNNWRNETRIAEHFTIDAEKAVTVPEPDEAKIKATYEANKQAFMAPEFRKLALLVLSVDQLKKTVTVTDAEAQAAYDASQKDYNTPERRRVQQIAFKDKAAAEAAKKAIAGGKSFADAAKEAGAKDSDIDLGLISKDRLIDPKIADAAFSLAKDTVSDPVEGRFATVLLRVSDIQPAVNRTFADVKDQVKDKVATTKAEAQLQAQLDQVEDQRSAGKSLKDIGSEMKLQFFEIPQTDRTNKDAVGKPAIMIQDSQGVLNAAFSSGVGVENDVIELSNGGYAWLDVLDITAQKQKPFEEVKAEAKQLTIAMERARLVTELANKLVERADKGEAMSVLATAAGAAKADDDAAVQPHDDAARDEPRRGHARLHPRQGPGRLGARQQRQEPHRLQGDGDHPGAAAFRGAAHDPHLRPQERPRRRELERVRAGAAGSPRHAHLRGRVQEGDWARQRRASAPVAVATRSRHSDREIRSIRLTRRRISRS